MTDLRAALLDRSVAALPDDWPLPRQHARRALERWLDEALDRVEDELFGRRFAQACPVPGRAPGAYQHRVLAGAPTLLAGIRFKGGDLAAPFVDLLAWDAPIPAAGWGPVVARLADAFAGFGPRWVRLRWPGAARPPLEPDRLEVDQRVVAGRLESLKARPRPWGEVAVDLRRLDDLSWFEAYQAAHAAWRAQAGQLGPEVFPTRRADFARAMETGAVVGLYQGGRWAGVMAAAREADRAIEGYCVQELFLDAPARGARRAAPLQRRLVDALADRGRDCLWGTIHRLNTPSLQTARRTGRRVVETLWFVRVG